MRKLLLATLAYAATVAIGCAGDAAAQTAATPPPISGFFENNAFGGALLSPDGRFLAVRMAKPGSRVLLTVIDLDTRTATVTAAYSDADVGQFQWVNDSRLVYTLGDRTEASGERHFNPGLYAVDRDGGRRIQLAARRDDQAAPQPWNTFLLDQPGSQDSDWIYVQRPMFDNKDRFFGTRLLHLNTLTGQADVAPEPEVDVASFLLDAKGEPRLAVMRNEVETQLYYRDGDAKTWRVLAGFATYRNTRRQIEPLGFGADGSLYVVANAGDNLATLRTLDVATGTLAKEALVATPGYDFAGDLIERDRLLGVRYTTDARTTWWFDPGMKAVQTAVDKALPATVNMISVPARPKTPWVLVESYSDVVPPRYMLYDTKSARLDPIGAAYPNIDPARMGHQEAIRYKARDGLAIPGLLTLPAGGERKRLPMVVLVHGGPWVRGPSWGWHPESQFLASRGYAVLEVEFRGSTGFGARHFEAGLKQWGLAMQNDVADGARWAIAQGIADPRRICIAGASYGGYAALMGLVNDPDLFRCAIDWVGVTDIELMYTGTWFTKSDLSEAAVRYGMSYLVGDLEKDAAQLAATSPIQQAHRITQPVLLAYGSEDHRVPIYHGERLYRKLSEYNKQVEWVRYGGEGHGWSLPANRIDFWNRVERFLKKSIGPDAERIGRGAVAIRYGKSLSGSGAAQGLAQCASGAVMTTTPAQRSTMIGSDQASGSIANAPSLAPSRAPARNLSAVINASLIVTSMSR